MKAVNFTFGLFNWHYSWAIARKIKLCELESSFCCICLCVVAVNNKMHYFRWLSEVEYLAPRRI